MVKPMASKLRHIGMFSGNTILGDGSVILIIDPNGVSQAIGASARLDHGGAGRSRDRAARDGRRQRVAPGVPRRLARSRRPCRCRSSRASKRSTARKIELSNDRYMVQYRGQLMPLVHVSGDGRDQARRRAAAAGVLRRRPLDGPCRRRDRRHRRGAARHPGRQRARRRARLRDRARPGHRNRRRRSLPAARLCRLVPPQGPALPAIASAACCWSTTRRSSATCCRRC